MGLADFGKKKIEEKHAYKKRFRPQGKSIRPCPLFRIVPDW